MSSISTANYLFSLKVILKTFLKIQECKINFHFKRRELFEFQYYYEVSILITVNNVILYFTDENI